MTIVQFKDFSRSKKSQAFHGRFDSQKLFMRAFFIQELFKLVPGDKNVSILHLSCRTSDLQFSLVLQTHARFL